MDTYFIISLRGDNSITALTVFFHTELLFVFLVLDPLKNEWWVPRNKKAHSIYIVFHAIFQEALSEIKERMHPYN